MALTDRTCQQKPTPGKDKWIPDAGRRGDGRLYLRITKAGAKLFYFRYTGPDGERVNLPIGEYSQERGIKGRFTLKEASDIAHEYSRLYKSGIKDLRDHLVREQRAKEAAIRAAEEAARREKEDATRGTLKLLLEAYVEWLKRRGKQSAGDVENIFKNHMFVKQADLCARKAKDVTVGELRQVLGTVLDKGHRRTAAKLRTYIRAAYAAAISAETDADAPASLMGFGLDSNPAAALATIKNPSTPGDRVLDRIELRAYLLELDKVEGPVARDALKLSLLLAGQRPTQLLRVRPIDVDLLEATITQYDPKGARQTARMHMLPLVGDALTIVESLLEKNKDKPSLFDAGEDDAVTMTALSDIVGDISDKLLEDKVTRAPFRLGDIRRTCETMLASLGISKDIRAQVLSHGISGVQATHYDRYEYMNEKKAALKVWEGRLAAIREGKEPESNVIEFKSTAA